MAELVFIQTFMNGATMVASLVITLFFLRFYRDTRDRFFLLFSQAFFLLGVERVVLELIGRTSSETHSGVYLFRCLAFIIIIYAVIDKNRH